jgi:hypothetical protein|nr:MAG TPA: hypothetical protein [Caudoviricetes sp.]
MYKCNNCDCKFENPRKVDLETYYGVYSTFGNSYGEMINLCPNCEDNDIIVYDEEEEKTIEERVYDYLVENNQGKENLIKNQELRRIFNVTSDKAMRKIIQNIREDKSFKRMVGSVSGVKGGFYICITDEEMEETINNIKHRANQMLRMCHVLEWKKELEK